MRSSGRAVAAVALLTAMLTGAVLATGAPVRAEPADDAEQLAERYAPIVMLRTQPAACDGDGEPFVPMSVDRILDNRQVALRQVGSGDPTVMRGPGAADLADLGAGFYLDFPGDALDPGCLYEQDNDRFNAGQPSVVYAHIVREDGDPEQLALQYWLYWYYNDWNNKHESDWEFVQLVFPAGSVAEALAVEPTSVGYAQHEGGERADWHDDKLQREGTHPVVYSSQRSHASYFSPAVYMGRSASEGFGCDDTEEPSTRVAPEVVVLPDSVASPDDPLAWIGFEGRWGERHGGPNNGPTGPNTKPQWTAPMTWQEDLRDASFVVPGGDSSAAEVIDAFCSVVGWGSVKYIEFVASPARVLLALAVLAALVVFLVRRTSWRIVGANPLRRRRRSGEIWRLGVAEYRRHPRVFATAGIIGVPVAVLAAVIGVVLTHLPFIGALRAGGRSGRRVDPPRHVVARRGRPRGIAVRGDLRAGGERRRRRRKRPPLVAAGVERGAAAGTRAAGGIPHRRRHHRSRLPDGHRRAGGDLAVGPLAVHAPGRSARGPRRVGRPAPQW